MHENSNLTTVKIDSITNKTGNITLYAKWEANQNTAYKEKSWDASKNFH